MPDVAFSVFLPTNRKFYYVEWTVPGKKCRVRRSTRKRVKRDADRTAQKIIDEWFARRGRVGDEAWGTFREAHEEEAQLAVKRHTRNTFGIVFNAIEEHIAPVVMSDLTPRAISKLQARWRAKKIEETSIRTYLTHLQWALKWAKSQGMIGEIPAIEFPQASDKAKGRAISEEEFDRVIAAVPKVITNPDAVPSWERLLRGLWCSSLRLNELLMLSWDDPTGIRVDLDGDFPAMIIPCGDDKAGENRIIPIPKDCAAVFAQTQKDVRRGKVFVLVNQRKRPDGGVPANMQYISAKICRIGQAAGVIVGKYAAKGKLKYASAHDLRRSAGRRWARQVRNILDLQSLMRHKDIRTTRKYYVHEDAADLAKVVAGFADTSAITPSAPIESQEAATCFSQTTSDQLPG